VAIAETAAVIAAPVPLRAEAEVDTLVAAEAASPIPAVEMLEVIAADNR
jgi:hypothetical protein